MKDKEYYTPYYDDCYNNLTADGKNWADEAKNLYNDVANSSFIAKKNIKNNSDGWECETADIFNEYFVYVNDCYNKMIGNILDPLIGGCNCLGELTNLLKRLKEANNNYVNLLLEYSREKSRKIDKMIRSTEGATYYIINPEYSIWQKKLADLMTKIEDARVMVEELQISVFESFREIKRYDSKVVEFINFVDCINMSISELDLYSFNDVPLINKMNTKNNNLHMYSYNDTNYSIVCEGYFLDAYKEYLLKKQYYQNRNPDKARWFKNACNDAAALHASTLNNYKFEVEYVKSNKNISKLGLDYKYENVVRESDGKNALFDIKQAVYNEIIIEGRSCTIQVGKTTENKGNRHWVTVIGLSDNVKGPNDLTPENILVLDNYDAKVKTLSDSDYDFYAWESASNEGVGVYQMRKASSEEITSILENRSKNYVFASR